MGGSTLRSLTRDPRSAVISIPRGELKLEMIEMLGSVVPSQLNEFNDLNISTSPARACEVGR